MLELKNITKDYPVADGVVHALRGISVNFRKNEFVSILGASGCGKTTLLNIIGGLDKYTSGDLLIQGVSTKKYNDRDWDTYRNHSIGFIFQSYHLIPHQTILQNVELALMISGVSKEERRRRAIEALEKVGLADKIKNRPNQLSGGQAQRVAIARALINDPEIVLADEPTGALDSKTSVQIMELLKEISKDRLVIMVTHNPELAEKYSTRIIRLLDGEVIDDTMPYEGASYAETEKSVDSGKVAETDKSSENISETETSELSQSEDVVKTEAAETAEPKTNKGKKKKTSMSMSMAFSLSLKNLLSKFKRTLMVSIAGSIGIIGVSMVLAISAGVQNYIASMEDDMLSGYPLQVSESTIDFNSLMDAANNSQNKPDITKLKDKVYVDSLLDTLMSLGGAAKMNEITPEYRDYVSAMPEEYYNALQFTYKFNMSDYIYTDFKVTDRNIPQDADTSGTYSVTGIRSLYTSILSNVPDYSRYSSIISTVTAFSELPDNSEYILSQYDVLATDIGKTEKLTEEELQSIFEDRSSIIMVVDENELTDLNFGQFGYLTEEEFLNLAFKAAEDPQYKEEISKDLLEEGMNFDKFIGENGKTFTWYPSDVVFRRTRSDETFQMSGFPVNSLLAPYTYNIKTSDFSDSDKADGGKIDMKVRAILQKKKGVSYGCLNSGLYYTKALTEHTIKTGMDSAIVDYIKKSSNPDGLNMLPYNYDFTFIENGEVTKKSACSAFTETGSFMSMMMESAGQNSNPMDIYKVNLSMLAGTDIPSGIKIYPLDFDTKDSVTDYLDMWNKACKEDGTGVFVYKNAEGADVTVEELGEGSKITYTDTVGLIIAMVNTMIEMITVALVAFTALSLVVSTVMVGIITYVSVVERVKEIGILRAVGARKKDIKRLFNAETFIIGLAAGLVGIGVTYILSLILNVIIGSLFGIGGIAALPIWQALIMIGISIILTLISGLIPASAAAKKDPVVALRTE